MHLKDLLGSIARVGYCIPVPDSYLVLHGPRCRKSKIMDKSINQNHIRIIRASLLFFCNLTLYPLVFLIVVRVRYFGLSDVYAYHYYLNLCLI